MTTTWIRSVIRWRPRFKPQFSLRTLLLSMAWIGLGLAWWRKPYVVEVVHDSVDMESPFSFHRADDFWSFYFHGYPFSRRPPPICCYAQVGSIFPAAIKTAPDDDLDLFRECRTMRRQLLGPPVLDGPSAVYWGNGSQASAVFMRNGMRHGIEKWFDPDGRKRGVLHWENGLKHGKELHWDEKGKLEARMLFDHGTPVGVHRRFRRFGLVEETVYCDGSVVRESQFMFKTVRDVEYLPDERRIERVWTEDRTRQLEFLTAAKDGNEGPAYGWHVDGSPRFEGWWRAGKREGRWTYWNSDGPPRWEVDFSNGRYVSVNGQAMNGLPAPGEPKSDGEARFLDALHEATELEFVETPLQEILDYLSERHKLPIQVDRRLTPDLESPDSRTISFEASQVPLGVALNELLDARGLTCRFRFGQVWITTQVDADAWQDRSGLGTLPTGANSALAAQLDEPTELEFTNSLLSSILEYLSERHRCSISCPSDRRIESGFWVESSVTLTMRNVFLRDALGCLCDQYNWQCHLDETGIVLSKIADD